MGWVIVRSTTQDHHDELLQRRTFELADTLEARLGEVGSALDVLSDIPLDGPGSPALFEQTVEPLVAEPVRYLGVVSVGDDGELLTVAAGADGSMETSRRITRSRSREACA